MSDEPPVRYGGPPLTSMVGMVLALVPVFLFGSLAVLIRKDIAFSNSQLGLTMSSYFLSYTLSAVAGGKIADRIGPRHGMLAGAMLNTSALLGIGILSVASWHVVGFLLLAGLGGGIGVPASNLVLARFVPVARQGIAFGFKQSAAPLATVVSGLAVPLLGLTFGCAVGFHRRRVRARACPGVFGASNDSPAGSSSGGPHR